MTFDMHAIEVSLYLLDFFYSYLLVQLKIHFINGSFFKKKVVYGLATKM
jgi:hypothetical protein